MNTMRDTIILKDPTTDAQREAFVDGAYALASCTGGTVSYATHCEIKDRAITMYPDPATIHRGLDGIEFRRVPNPSMLSGYSVEYRYFASRTGGKYAAAPSDWTSARGACCNWNLANAAVILDLEAGRLQ